MNKKLLFPAILIVLAAMVLAGVFYWLKKPASNIVYTSTPTPTRSPANGQLPLLENEVATSTSYHVAGEISRGNPDKKQIIFTFDTGAGTNSAQKILEVAKQHNVTVTFFSTGKFAEKNPELIKQISTAGHEIFNHTYSHPYLTKITDEQIKEELEKADEIISGLTGQITKPYFRPPYGDRNAHVLAVAGNLGWQSVYWTTDALDWETGKTADEVKARIYSHLQNGAIFLMHAGDDITGQVLNEIFTYMESQDYKIVSLSEGLK